MANVAYMNMIWKCCRNLFDIGIEHALGFISEGGCEKFQHIEPHRIEMAVNSRYLHRGYYCPSPVFDRVLTNSRRGKILSKATKRSKITHQYYFDSNNDIYLIAYYAGSTNPGYEYIIKRNDMCFGFVFGTEGILGGISVEVFSQNKLQSYMWASCYNASSTSDDWKTHYLRYETYVYGEDGGLALCNMHFVALLDDEYNKQGNAVGLVNCEQYTFCQEDKI